MLAKVGQAFPLGSSGRRVAALENRILDSAAERGNEPNSARFVGGQLQVIGILGADDIQLRPERD